MWPAPVRQTRWVGRATEIRHRPRNRGSKPAAMGRDRKGPDTQASRRGSPASRGRCPPPARERELDAPYGAASRAAVQAFSDATSLAPPLQIRSIIVIPRTGMSAAGRGAQTVTILSPSPAGVSLWARVLGKKCMAPAGPNTGDLVHSSEGSGRPAVNDGGADRAAPWVG